MSAPRKSQRAANGAENAPTLTFECQKMSPTYPHPCSTDYQVRMMMNVVFSTYPMAFHTPGGGEIQLLAYRDHLPTVGVNVSLFDLWKPRFSEADIVHFFSCVGGSIHFCDFVKRLGKPLVITSSLWITESTRHLYPVDEIRSQLLLADRIITNSQTESDCLSRVLNIQRHRFSSVYNGVDDIFREKPSPSIFRNTIGVEKPFILNVGNIEPRKNQLLLAQAMSVLPEHDLVLIGHIRDQDYYHQVMAARKRGRIHYLGPLDHHGEMLRSAYQACEAFCLPSTLETPGLAALEAAAQGCRLIVTEEGSTREYFGDCARYVQPHSLESIQCALIEATGLAGNGFRSDSDRFVARYAWSQVVNDLKAIYESVC